MPGQSLSILILGATPSVTTSGSSSFHLSLWSFTWLCPSNSATVIGSWKNSLGPNKEPGLRKSEQGSDTVTTKATGSLINLSRMPPSPSPASNPCLLNAFSPGGWGDRVLPVLSSHLQVAALLHSKSPLFSRRAHFTVSLARVSIWGVVPQPKEDLS